MHWDDTRQFLFASQNVKLNIQVLLLSYTYKELYITIPLINATDIQKKLHVIIKDTIYSQQKHIIISPLNTLKCKRKYYAFSSPQVKGQLHNLCRINYSLVCSVHLLTVHLPRSHFLSKCTIQPINHSDVSNFLHVSDGDWKRSFRQEVWIWQQEYRLRHRITPISLQKDSSTERISWHFFHLDMWLPFLREPFKCILLLVNRVWRIHTIAWFCMTL